MFSLTKNKLEKQFSCFVKIFKKITEKIYELKKTFFNFAARSKMCFVFINLFHLLTF
jgi:hypothetical protein